MSVHGMESAESHSLLSDFSWPVARSVLPFTEELSVCRLGTATIDYAEDAEDREFFVGEARFGFGFTVLDAGGEGEEFGAGCGFDEFL